MKNAAAGDNNQMKSLKPTKRLSIHRETLASLSSKQLEGVAGGVSVRANCTLLSCTVCCPSKVPEDCKPPVVL